MQLRNEYSAFQDAGAEVVALAVATLDTVDSGVRKVIDPPYPVLADPNHEVAEGFNVYDLFDNGIAAPSVFVIDRDSRIVWSYVGRSSRDRPGVSAILDHLP